jgi:hypothetical protein
MLINGQLGVWFDEPASTGSTDSPRQPCSTGERKEIHMEWGKLGTIGGLFLAAYLLVIGIGALVGGTAIPVWFTAILAVSAGVLILVGR